MSESQENKKHWEILREQYLNASPSFRAKVARQRKEILDSGPNQLVANIASLEGLTRSKLIDSMQHSTGLSVAELYEWWGSKNTEKLLTRLCKEKKTTPHKAFGDEDWKDLKESVKYRNLLVHESTYLNGATSSRLINATNRIFDEIESW